MKHIEHETFLNIILKDRHYFESFFKDMKSFKELTQKIQKESKNFSKFGITDNFKFEGDLFEIFAEIFFKLLASDNRVGICNYTPGNPLEDNGVDGSGIGIDGKPATVQVKFRSNIDKELLERDIKQFGFQSIVVYNVDKDTKNNMVVFTTAPGLHWHTDGNVFQGRMRVIGKNEIKKLVDNNFCFWENLNDLVNSSLKYLLND